jgi:hypothetical protein
MELYDAAIKAFPKPAGVLEHQREIVKRHLGGDAQEVYDALRKLIGRSQDRSISDQDAPDNLHTSAAAALHQLIRERRIDPVHGAETVFDHVTSAIAFDQFSLHAFHVHAQTLLTIASGLRGTNQLAFMANLERAARITARGLLLIQQATAGRSNHSASDSLKLFQDLQAEIVIAHPDIEMGYKEATQLFEETGDQTGFAFIARLLLTKASNVNKGHAFKKVDDYLRYVFKALGAAQKQPCDELLLCRIELVVNWQLNENKGPVVWEQFEEDLLKIVSKPRYAPDAMWTFYLGVAEYHLKKFNEAEGYFQLLRSRSLPSQTGHVIRCLYLGDKSTPRVLEGTIVRGSYNRFLYCSELGTDVLIRKGEFIDRPDEIKHFKIGFSFYGTIALERSSSE